MPMNRSRPKKGKNEKMGVGQGAEEGFNNIVDRCVSDECGVVDYDV